jgi:hypothetical protein
MSNVEIRPQFTRTTDGVPGSPPRNRPKMGKKHVLTLRLQVDKVASCLVSPKTNSPSPTHRSVRTGTRKAISYHFINISSTNHNRETSYEDIPDHQKQP